MTLVTNEKTFSKEIAPCNDTAKYNLLVKKYLKHCIHLSHDTDLETQDNKLPISLFTIGIV